MTKDDSFERYSRHLVLKQIGGQGQELLGKAKVLIIGLGGLGSPVVQYISSSGVGKIGLIDNDRVDISNLHRQTIFSMKDIDGGLIGGASLDSNSFLAIVNSF